MVKDVGSALYEAMNAVVAERGGVDRLSFRTALKVRRARRMFEEEMSTQEDRRLACLPPVEDPRQIMLFDEVKDD